MNPQHNPESFDQMHSGEQISSQESVYLIQDALEQLNAMQQGAERLRPEVAVLTTNPEIESRQIRIVDARGSDDPQFRAYLKLANWVEAREKASQSGYEDTKYGFEILHGFENHQYNLESRNCRVGEVGVKFIYGESVLTTDGLVELSLPASEEALAEHISQAINTLTGHSIWDEESREASLSDWKQQTYKTYHKLPDGPLTQAQLAEAESLQIEQTAVDHISLVAPGQHKKYHLDRSPHEAIAPVHEVMRLENALSVITEGAITSNQHRMERGYHERGRSAAVDMLSGGGDVVYTYAYGESHEMPYSSSPTFRIRPEALDRMDVRAYETDAYGSKETTTQTPIGQAMDRPVKRSVVTDYNERLKPEDFSTLAGVHELCFEGSVSIAECSELVLPDSGESSFHDFWWDKLLVPYISDTVRYKGNLVQQLQNEILEVWGQEPETREKLGNIGFTTDQIEYLCAGMNQPVVERAVSKLKVLGIESINGKPASDFIRAPKAQ